jgi:hypothetical protein
VDERLHSILAAVGREEIARVAAAVLGVAVAEPKETAFAEITKPHADARTIGILRVSGKAAVDPGEGARAWSAVAKLVDPTIVSFNNNATSPETEERVYEQGLFTGTGLRFRPAHCYHISRPADGCKLLWLEDLTNADSSPFAVDELMPMVRDLGEWNAAVAADPPHLEWSVWHDFPVRRWEYWDFPGRLEGLAEMAGEPMVREMYANQPIEVASAYAAVMAKLVERSKTMPHALSFSDAPISNFFHRPHETVAVDWSGLGMDPVGADGGCFIGSALTFGRRLTEVAVHERELFDSYAAGLADGGTTLNRKALRSAYLSHMGFYLGSMAVLPTMITGPQSLLPHEFWEKRLDAPIAEFGSVAAQIVDVLPSYIAEVEALLQ